MASNTFDLNLVVLKIIFAFCIDFIFIFVISLRLCKNLRFVSNFVKFGRFACHIFHICHNMTIFKMAAVRHVGFSKLVIFIIRPSYVCDYASSLQISYKSDNMEPSYNQECFSIWRPSTSWFCEFLNFVMFPSPILSAYQILWNLDDSRLRYGDITIFTMAAVRHVGFIVTSSYCAGRLSLTLLTLC